MVGNGSRVSRCLYRRQLATTTGCVRRAPPDPVQRSHTYQLMRTAAHAHEIWFYWYTLFLHIFRTHLKLRTILHYRPLFPRKLLSSWSECRSSSLNLCTPPNKVILLSSFIPFRRELFHTATKSRITDHSTRPFLLPSSVAQTPRDTVTSQTEPAPSDPSS
jgi:hypothetical protein